MHAHSAVCKRREENRRVEERREVKSCEELKRGEGNEERGAAGRGEEWIVEERRGEG